MTTAVLLPENLLRQLDTARTLFSHEDSARRPACAGTQAAGFGHTKVTVNALAAARTYCARCPVLAECGAYADAREEIGLWGGEQRTVVHTPRRRYRKTSLLPA